MLTRLFPAGVKVTFEDRPYNLGETINLTVELSPRLDIEVREGRVDLVCEERYEESLTVTRPRHHAAPTRYGVVPLPSTQESIEVTEKRRESYVHSSVVFLKGGQLVSGTTARHNAWLMIKPEPPAHADQAALSWRLVTTVDVAGARDIKARRSVKVALA